jgi:hypothetical protein
MMTCAHCGEPIAQTEGVWYHPHRRFRAQAGPTHQSGLLGAPPALPTLCDFGARLGPTHATPVAVTPADKDFLCSIHVAADDENFLLEALWLEWQHANIHRGVSPCADCGAAPDSQHSLECQHHARMNFDGNLLRHRHAIH